VLYTGNGGTGNHTGVGFQPDFVWIKGRNIGENHAIHDAVRGTAAGHIRSDTTNAESTNEHLLEYGTDGFNFIGGSPTSAAGHQQVNSASYNYVAWNWKANGSGSSNTDGNITSTVSVNTNAGFSIVKYVGTGNADLRVGHGLSVAPEMIILKSRDRAENWFVYHEATGTGREMFLNTAAADASNTNAMTVVNSSYFESDGDIPNRSGDNYIAYCFHSVDGYSKVGSYAGNSSTDGTFVYTGFSVKYIMIHDITNGQGWWIFDNVRDTDGNPMGKYLGAERSNTEYTGDTVDFVSNGFKWRHADNAWNVTNDTYIYIAFAESPFKYSNAR
jgi:hypothetical protein